MKNLENNKIFKTFARLSFYLISLVQKRNAYNSTAKLIVGKNNTF